MKVWMGGRRWHLDVQQGRSRLGHHQWQFERVGTLREIPESRDPVVPTSGIKSVTLRGFRSQLHCNSRGLHLRFSAQLYTDCDDEEADTMGNAIASVGAYECLSTERSWALSNPINQHPLS